ncbi:hypothetical protein EDB85DRAFT_1886432 [Lactarius pseudohatsudake]|nr:hypothetical protein EDB85DRAFT_1886432 [Lactarius pseudohatsudake]
MWGCNVRSCINEPDGRSEFLGRIVGGGDSGVCEREKGNKSKSISSIDPDSWWDRGRRRRGRADPFRKKEVVYANGENSVPMIKTTWRRGKGVIRSGKGERDEMDGDRNANANAE